MTKRNHDTLIIVLPDTLKEAHKTKIINWLRQEVPHIGIYPDTMSLNEAFTRADVQHEVTKRVKGYTP